MPVQLQQGTKVTARFTTDRSGTYWVVLRVRRDLPYEELERILDLGWGVDGESPVVIPWEIRSGSEVVAGDAGHRRLAGWSNDEVIVRLGSFESEEDREYTISARVERSIEELLGHRTEVAVEADPMYVKDAMVGDFVRSAVGLVCVAPLGGVAFLVGGVLWARRRRRAAVSPGSTGSRL
jgi:hypothetical protein